MLVKQNENRPCRAPIQWRHFNDLGSAGGHTSSENHECSTTMHFHIEVVRLYWNAAWPVLVLFTDTVASAHHRGIDWGSIDRTLSDWVIRAGIVLSVDRVKNSSWVLTVSGLSVDGQLGAAQDLSSEINRDARLLCRLLFLIRSIVRPKTCYKEWCPRLWNVLLAVVSVEINCTAQNLLQKMSRDAR